MGLATEQLDMGAVQEAGVDGGVGEAVHVFDEVLPDHEAGRQSGPAGAVAIERAEGSGEALPVDQARETDKGGRRSTRFTRPNGRVRGTRMAAIRAASDVSSAAVRRGNPTSGRHQPPPRFARFLPPPNATLQTRILAPVGKPSNPADLQLVHGRLPNQIPGLDA